MSESAAGPGPLALVCGAGRLPLAVADYAAARGRQVLLFPMRGIARPEDYAGRAHTWMRLGQFGVFERAMKAANCRDMVLLGAMVRPNLWQVRFDWRTFRALPRIIGGFRGGDDHLISHMVRLIEEQGFHVLGAHEVAPEILVPEGALGAVQPSERDRADIAFALDYLNAASPFDIGQAVVVAGRHVLAVEAAEGTDAMLVRVAEMRRNGRVRAAAGTGVLVKAPKAQQDRRFDLPSIGPATAENVVAAGLAGVAVVAGETIVAEPEKLIAAADRGRIFVAGVAGGSQR